MKSITVVPQSPSSSNVADPATDPISKKAWRSLAVGAAGFVLFGFNSTATNLAFGDIADTFSGVSESTVSWVASGYFIASAAFLPLGGRLADRLGRRRIFNIGLLGFIATAILSAISPNIWVLIAARSLQAVSGALLIPASLSMALPNFPVARRSTAVAAWSAAGPLSASIAPSIAAFLLNFTTWRWVYFVSAPIAGVALLTSYRFVDESVGDQNDNRLDIGGTVMAVAAIAMLVIGITQGPSWGWSSGATIGVIVGALIIAATFVLRSRKHPAPLINFDLFRTPEVAIANIANLFISITSLSIWLIWPLWLSRVWGYEPFQVGLAITIGPIFAGPSTILGGRIAERFGHRLPIIVGSAISTSAVLWGFFMLSPEPNYLVEFMPSVAGFGLGWGLSHPQMNSWALLHVGPNVFGEVNAAFNTLRNLGAAVGTAGAITIIGSADRPDILAAFDRAYLFFAGWVGLSCLTVLFGTVWLRRRDRTERAAMTARS
jgi:EmrB/QacA subfamily drug resistance transporter